MLKEKSKECLHKLEASEKRKTKENTILLAGHKDEMFKLVKSHKLPILPTSNGDIQHFLYYLSVVSVHYFQLFFF